MIKLNKNKKISINKIILMINYNVIFNKNLLNMFKNRIQRNYKK